MLRDVPGDLETAISRTAALVGRREHDVRIVAGYHAAFRDEVDGWIAEVDRQADEAPAR